ncbi:MAG: translation initiation factor IF-2 [Candidatus Zixiibacteriota bacterium]
MIFLIKKKRLYQVAKEYNISSEALLNILRELGFKVKSYMSGVDQEMLVATQKKFEKEKEAVKKEYVWKKTKLKERKEKDELSRRVDRVKDRLKAHDLQAQKLVEPKKLESKKGKKFKGKKFKRTFDHREVEESVKKTLTKIDSIKKAKKYKRKPHEEVIKEEKAPKALQVTEYMTVAELAASMEVKPTEVISKCLELGLVASINQRLDMDAIQTIALEFGFDVEEMKEVGIEQEEVEMEEALMVPRAPVITIMGHVDHGKTSLLDYIRKSNIIAGESGGITQHIGAYVVSLPSGRITFLDTPGHEAFTAMRSRGAQVTDIVILVVAADDAVMPQTIEAIDHAKAAGVPIIVAINKIDLPEAKPESIKRELSKQGLLAENWGGKTIFVELSAKTGENVDKLLEMILLQADMMEFKCNPDRRAMGVVIESRLDRGRGPIASVLIQNGSLKVGDSFLVGVYWGKVRAMFDNKGESVKLAGPSTPVQILGSSGLPQAGDTFVVTEAEQQAKEISLKRVRLRREKDFRRLKSLSLSEISEKIAEGKIKELRLVLKGDVAGSVEALSETLEKLSVQDVRVNIIHQGIGAINESDVLLAVASQAIVIGFHVRPDARAREIAAREKVDVRLYTVIYEAEKEIRDALEGLLEPEIKEEVSATVEVRELFRTPKIGQIAGCYVRDGAIKRGDKVRVIRDGVVIYQSVISSLKRFKDDVREVSSGFECGLKVENYEDIKVGDILEAYLIKQLAKKLTPEKESRPKEE